jgi:hypothetical protein
MSSTHFCCRLVRVSKAYRYACPSGLVMRYTRNEPHRDRDWLDRSPAGSESETPSPCHHRCEASSKRKRSTAWLSTRCGQTCSAIYLTELAFWLVAFFLQEALYLDPVTTPTISVDQQLKAHWAQQTCLPSYNSSPSPPPELWRRE